MEFCGLLLVEVNMEELRVIHEDNHVLVAIKPQNVLSQKDNTGDVDMTAIVENYLKTKYGKKGNVYIGLVHRLDRPTGGVMVFAKTSKAAERLSKAIQAGEMEKEYLCVVSGTFKEKTGKMVHYLKKNALTNMVYVATETTDGAKRAELEYEVLEEKADHSLVKVRLLTGRGHQIRVQMSSSGHIISGDVRYGSVDKCKMALWAVSLKFEHPVTKQTMRFISYPDCETTPWKSFNIDGHLRIK